VAAGVTNATAPAETSRRRQDSKPR